MVYFLKNANIVPLMMSDSFSGMFQGSDGVLVDFDKSREDFFIFQTFVFERIVDLYMFPNTASDKLQARGNNILDLACFQNSTELKQ